MIGGGVHALSSVVGYCVCVCVEQTRGNSYLTMRAVHAREAKPASEGNKQRPLATPWKIANSRWPHGYYE